jgi:hypothetical protein
MYPNGPLLPAAAADIASLISSSADAIASAELEQQQQQMQQNKKYNII